MVHQQDVVQPLRFVGQVEDTETGFYYNYHRYYNPKIGRFIQHLVKVAGYTQPDPIGLAGGINPYVYADNNPIMKVDPSGEFVPQQDKTVIEKSYLFTRSTP